MFYNSILFYANGKENVLATFAVCITIFSLFDTIFLLNFIYFPVLFGFYAIYIISQPAKFCIQRALICGKITILLSFYYCAI